MSKIAFIFPGQGAQKIDMGKEIIEYDEDSKTIFDKANEILDFDLENLCYSDNELIHNTGYTQPALLTISIAILKAVEKLNIKPDYVAGLSLGEYTALVANGALSFEDAITLVRKRGLLMEEAAKNHKGSMAAVIGSDEGSIKNILKDIDGYVDIANYNSNKQIVIAGEEESVIKAINKLTQENIRTVSVKVSGAFHSKLMEDAKEGLYHYLKEVEFNDFTIPYVANVNGKIIKQKDEICELLSDQVISPVKWVQCVNTMIHEGVDTFVEIGPSKVLKGLIKKIDRKVKVISISDVASLKELEVMLEGVNG